MSDCTVLPKTIVNKPHRVLARFWYSLFTLKQGLELKPRKLLEKFEIPTCCSFHCQTVFRFCIFVIINDNHAKSNFH